MRLIILFFISEFKINVLLPSAMDARVMNVGESQTFVFASFKANGDVQRALYHANTNPLFNLQLVSFFFKTCSLIISFW